MEYSVQLTMRFQGQFDGARATTQLDYDCTDCRQDDLNHYAEGNN
jgi:hypothetical protein